MFSMPQGLCQCGEDTTREEVFLCIERRGTTMQMALHVGTFSLLGTGPIPARQKNLQALAFYCPQHAEC